MIMTAANTVSRASVPAVATGHHQGDDQCDLDHCHGEREDQRAERFADPMGNHFGMVDGGDHRREQDDRHETDQGPAEFAPPDGRQHAGREDRHGEAPDGHPVPARAHVFPLN